MTETTQTILLIRHIGRNSCPPEQKMAQICNKDDSIKMRGVPLSLWQHGFGNFLVCEAIFQSGSEVGHP